jgi:hypothetical protein
MGRRDIAQERKNDEDRPVETDGCIQVSMKDRGYCPGHSATGTFHVKKVVKDAYIRQGFDKRRGKEGEKNGK